MKMREIEKRAGGVDLKSKGLMGQKGWEQEIEITRRRHHEGVHTGHVKPKSRTGVILEYQKFIVKKQINTQIFTLW